MAVPLLTRALPLLLIASTATAAPFDVEEATPGACRELVYYDKQPLNPVAEPCEIHEFTLDKEGRRTAWSYDGVTGDWLMQAGDTPPCHADGAPDRTTRYELDDQGRRIATIRREDYKLAHQRDAQGRETAEVGPNHTLSSTWEGACRTGQEYRSGDRVRWTTESTCDEQGNPVSTLRRKGNGTYDRKWSTRWNYDDAGRPIRRRKGGEVWTMTWDERGRLATLRIDADGDGWFERRRVWEYCLDEAKE